MKAASQVRQRALATRPRQQTTTRLAALLPRPPTPQPCTPIPEPLPVHQPTCRSFRRSPRRSCQGPEVHRGHLGGGCSSRAGSRSCLGGLKLGHQGMDPPPLGPLLGSTGLGARAGQGGCRGSVLAAAGRRMSAVCWAVGWGRGLLCVTGLGACAGQGGYRGSVLAAAGRSVSAVCCGV